MSGKGPSQFWILEGYGKRGKEAHDEGRDYYDHIWQKKQHENAIHVIEYSAYASLQEQFQSAERVIHECLKERDVAIQALREACYCNTPRLLSVDTCGPCEARSRLERCE